MMEGRNASSEKQSGYEELSKRDLNFGWFTLPVGSEGKTMSATPSKSKLGDPTSSGSMGEPYPCGSSEPVTVQDASTGGGDRGLKSRMGSSMGGVACADGNENIVMDWPLSKAGQEQMRFQPMEVDCKERPATASARPQTSADQHPQVPPTPLPPLSWQGYREKNRPTYKTWKEEWHASNSNKLSGIEENDDGDDDHDCNNNAEVNEDGCYEQEIEWETEIEDLNHMEGNVSTAATIGATNCAKINATIAKSASEEAMLAAGDSEFTHPCASTSGMECTSSGLEHLDTHTTDDRFCFPDKIVNQNHEIPPQSENEPSLKKNSILDTAKNLMKWCGFRRSKSTSHIELLKYRKLQEEDAQVNFVKHTE